eukprot:1886758-Amphidinium_carterae.1
MSRGWVHAFLLGAGLKVQDHLQMKLVWLCREKGVGFANVYNIDESMVHLVPSPEKGWTFSPRPTSRGLGHVLLWDKSLLRPTSLGLYPTCQFSRQTLRT